MVAVGQGRLDGCHAGQGRCDAIDDGHVNARRAQVINFFPATTKNQRVAAFESNHVFAIQGGLDHELVDKRLGGGAATAALADPNHPGRWIGQGQDGVAHQIVHHDDAGRLQGFQGLEGQQIWVAWAGADQGHFGMGHLLGHGKEGTVEGAPICSAKRHSTDICWASGDGTGC